VRYLRRSQHSDGGFGQYPDYGSNTQSTSWAVQGLVAVGRDPTALKRGGHTPLAYIRSLARADGSIRYSKSSSQTPVWVTAQALAALERRPFPLSPVRAKHPGKGSAAGAGAGAGKGAKRGPGGSAAAAAAATGAAAGASATGGAGTARTGTLRRAAEHVGVSEPGRLTAAGLLLLSGAALLLAAAGAAWRHLRPGHD